MRPHFSPRTHFLTGFLFGLWFTFFIMVAL